MCACEQEWAILCTWGGRGGERGEGRGGVYRVKGFLYGDWICMLGSHRSCCCRPSREARRARLASSSGGGGPDLADLVSYEYSERVLQIGTQIGSPGWYSGLVRQAGTPSWYEYSVRYSQAGTPLLVLRTSSQAGPTPFARWRREWMALLGLRISNPFGLHLSGGGGVSGASDHVWLSERQLGLCFESMPGYACIMDVSYGALRPFSITSRTLECSTAVVQTGPLIVSLFCHGPSKTICVAL